METKHKTLAECKDEVARKHGHATFNRVRFAGTEAQLKIMDEAAELYAGQTKQSDPDFLTKQNAELVELIKIAQNNIPVGGSKQSQERYLNFMERSTEILKQIENTPPKN